MQGIYLFVILLVVSGIFYGFSTAAENVNQEEVMRLSREGDTWAQLFEILQERPREYQGAIPLLFLTSGLALAVGGGLTHWVLWPLASLIAGSLVLALGRLGTFHPLDFLKHTVRLVWLLSRLLWPLTGLISIVSRFLCLPFGITLDQKEDAMTEEEIISMVGEAHEQGVIEENEAEMIANVITFNETQAHEIMTHRTNVIAFEQEEVLSDVVDRMLEEGKSRYPVYGGSLDNILGIVHYKDTLKFLTKNSWARYEKLSTLPGLIREATLIPETRSISDLFQAMQVHKTHMAIVVDEYGQVAGLVSMEDILEEIVGDILDEYDHEEASFHRQKGGGLVIDALTRLSFVEEELGVDFSAPEFETLNGYLTAKLGHIPERSDLDKSLEAEGYRFTILSLGNRTIGRVRAQKIEEESPAGCETAQGKVPAGG